LGTDFFAEGARFKLVRALHGLATVGQPAFALIFDLGQRFRNTKDAN
jgi:hypothetical protein